MSDSDYDVDSPVPNDIEDEGLECEPFFAVGVVKKGKKNPFTTFLHITSNPTKANVTLWSVESNYLVKTRQT